MASVPDDEADVFVVGEADAGCDMFARTDVDCVSNVAPHNTLCIRGCEGVTTAVGEKGSHDGAGGPIMLLGPEPIVAQALARRIVEGRIMAWRSERNCGHQPPLHSLVELVPLG